MEYRLLPVKLAIPTAPMSTAHFYCVICGAPIFRGAGSTRPLVQCPKCAHVVPVPEATSLADSSTMRVFPRGVLSLEVIFQCEKCECHLQIDARAEGTTVNCARCQHEVTVPRWSCRAPSVELSAEEIDFLTSLEPAARDAHG